MYWKPDRTTVEKAVFRERLADVIQKDEWIIDGNYGSTIELRLKACDTVVFLDYSPDVCLDGIMKRRGKVRSDMPWTEKEDEEDEQFIEFVKSFDSQSRPMIVELLDRYPQKEIFIFKDREEADRFLNQL